VSIFDTLGRLFARPLGAGMVEPRQPIFFNEKDWLGDQIKIYASPTVKLWPLRDELSNPTEETLEMRAAYPALLKEPTLKASFFGSMHNVASLEMVCTPADYNNKMDREVAKFTRYYILRRRQTCLHLVESMGYGGRIHGYSLSHKKRIKETVGPWAGKWVLKEFKPKPVTNNRIVPVVDEYNNLKAIQSNWPNRNEYHDPADFVFFTYLKLLGSLTGMSDFRAAKRACMFKEATIKLRMIALDKYTGPYLTAKYPGAQDALRKNLETELAKARAAGYIVMPDGCEVNVVDLTLKSTQEFRAAIEDFDREIAIATNFASLHIFTSQGPSDPRGDSQVQQKQSQIGDWYIAALMAETLQEQVVPEAVEDNFGAEYDHPIVSIGGVESGDILNELNVGSRVQSLGGGLEAREVYRRAGWTMPEGTPDVLLPPLPPVSAKPITEATPPTPPTPVDKPQPVAAFADELQR
jgi:hypothetical protein